MRRRRGCLWAGVYVGLFGAPDADPDPDETEPAEASSE
jgi:hypothetical protein